MSSCAATRTTKPITLISLPPNKACVCARVKRYRELNSDKVKANWDRWSSANKDRVRATKKRWQDKNKELAQALVKDWQRRNPHKTREQCAKRYAAKTMATPAWASHAAILAIYAEAVAKKLTVDHIVPLRSSTVCGLHCEANLRLVTRTENRAKSNRWWPDMP